MEKANEDEKEKLAADAHRWRLHEAKQLIENIMILRDGKWIPAYKAIKQADGNVVYVHI